MLTFPAPHSSCSVANLPSCPLPYRFVPLGALGATGQPWRSLQLGLYCRLLCPTKSRGRLLNSRQSRGPLMCPRQPRRAINTEPTHWRSLHLGGCWRIVRNPPGKLVSILFQSSHDAYAENYATCIVKKMSEVSVQKIFYLAPVNTCTLNLSSTNVMYA